MMIAGLRGGTFTQAGNGDGKSGPGGGEKDGF